MTAATHDVKSKAQLKRAYREKAPPMGVFAIRCPSKGYAVIGSSLNAQGSLNRVRFELETRMHRAVAELRDDWAALGPDGFTFEVLDVLEQKEGATSDPREELQVLEALWSDRLGASGVRVFKIDRTR